MVGRDSVEPIFERRETSVGSTESRPTVITISSGTVPEYARLWLRRRLELAAGVSSVSLIR
jgi:hypothetical protein